MGDVYWSVHSPLAAFAAQNGVKVAVETGTFFGSGSLQLAALFDEVWTVERHGGLSREISCMYSSVPNLKFVSGRATDGLSTVLQKTEGPYFFFLDAHWFPARALENENSEGANCEILEEIKEIAKHCSAEDGSIIVVDDADMFLRSLPPDFDGSFPSISMVIDALRSFFQAKCVDVVDDVIFASSDDNKSVLENYLAVRARIGCPSYKKLSL